MPRPPHGEVPSELGCSLTPSAEADPWEEGAVRALSCWPGQTLPL